MANMIHAAAAKHRERMKEKDGVSPTKESGSPVKTVLGALAMSKGDGLEPHMKPNRHHSNDEVQSTLLLDFFPIYRTTKHNH